MFSAWAIAALLTSAAIADPPDAAQPQGTSDTVDYAADLYLDGDAGAAIPLLESSIRRIEGQQGATHPDLVIPLGFLGAAYHRQDRHEEALDVLARARSIARLHEGENNRTQLPLIYVQADSLKILERLDEAEAYQREALDVVREHHGADSMEAALAMGRLAEWLADQQRYDESLILFSGAIEQARKTAGGADTPAMLPLLQGMAVVQLAANRTPERSLQLVQRLVELSDEGNEFDTVARIEVRLLYGDLLMRFSREKQALEAYGQAWAIADAAGDEKWLQKLAAPRKAAGRLKPVDAIPDSREHFVFRYNLRPDGRPAQAVLTRSNASPMVSHWALQRFREMRFQPPFIDGRPVALQDESGVFVP